MTPDLLVLGTVHTLDPARPRAEALLARNGRVLKLGTAAECRAEAHAGVRVVELGAGCAVPGLADAHGHVVLHARALEEVRCGGAPDEAACAALAAERARALPAGSWVRGRGWDQNLWPGQAYPTARALSAAVPGHPALLERVDGHVAWVNARALALVGIDAGTPDPAGGRILRDVRAVKLFADGALGSRGAALLDGYADEPGGRGLFLLAPEALRARLALVVKAGFQPAVHAIGDAACREVIAAFAELARGHELARLRPRVEHLQLVRGEDLPGLREVGGIASMQPIHAVNDAPWVAARLGHGSAALRGAYAWRQVAAAGIPLAFGSDFPVESPDPRLGLAAAEGRLPAGAADPWMPEERLTRAEALRGFTWGAAYASFAEDRRGILREGADADLTLFGEDLMSVELARLPEIPIAGRVVGGRVELSPS